MGQKKLGTWVGQHGFAASPIVYQDKVIIANSQQKDQLGPGQAPGESIVYAFDAKTGKESLAITASHKPGLVCGSLHL